MNVGHENGGIWVSSSREGVRVEKYLKLEIREIIEGRRYEGGIKIWMANIRLERGRMWDGF